MKTIFIAKSEQLLCDTLASYCNSIGLETIGCTTDGRVAMDVIEEKRPDYAFIEAQLPSMNGIDIVKKLRKKGVFVRIILYLRNHDATLLREAFSLRVSSLLFSEDDLDEFSNCFFGLNRPRLENNHVTDHSPVFPNPGQKYELLSSLTPAQLRILSFVGSHKTMPEIAKNLYISPHTVNNHMANIRKKLNIQGRGAILKFALAIKHRLVEKDGKVLVSF